MSRIKVETHLELAASKETIFEAIVNPEQMSKYFITSGTERLDEAQTVTWSWDDCGATLEVSGIEVDPPSGIRFNWSASDVETQVEFVIEDNGDQGSIVRVSEDGWERDDEGIGRSLQQMQGWMHMLCCLKAYLEFGINLRVGSNTQTTSG